MSALDSIRDQVEQARDAYYAGLDIEQLEQWRLLADRLWILEAGAGLKPMWRGPYPREAIRPRVAR